MHTFLLQLVVQNGVFIVDANDPDVELDEYACDWDTCVGGAECGDVAIASSCDVQLKSSRARKRRSGKQGKHTCQRLHDEKKRLVFIDFPIFTAGPGRGGSAGCVAARRYFA